MKKIRILLPLLLVLSLLAACGATAQSETADTAANAGTYQEVATEDTMTEVPEAAPAEGETASTEAQSTSGITEGTATEGDLSERIIYSAYAEIETTDFDASLEVVYDLLDQYDAFVENSSVNGSNLYDTYSGTVSHRSASFTLRVPKESYSAMTSGLDAVGNVTYLSSNAENITAQYTDTESQLSAYELQEERLLDILSQAENVEDMIELESRLSEIRYQKEALTSQLKNWDNQVAYSSVTLSLQEVQVLTPEPQEEKTYWQQVGDGFLATVNWMGRAGKALFRVFVAALPILLPIAAVIVITVLLCRRKKKHVKSGTPQPPSDPPKA